MRKLLCIAGSVLLLAILGYACWHLSRPNEPTYEGKMLSQWLEHHVASSAADPPYGSEGWRKAEKALKEIGTNGIPTLLRMIRAKDPPPAVRRVRSWAEQKGLVRARYRYAYQRNEEAEYAFQVLGASASNAVPGLIQIYQEERSPSSKRCAALALGSIGKPARPALPALLSDFTHTNREIRFYAVTAAYHIGGDPTVLVPAFQSVLGDPSVDVRWNAVVGLSSFGRRAMSVVPDLVRLLDDPAKVGDSSLKGQVEIALWRIAPEKVGKPLVVEEATPVTQDGVTVQIVDAVFDGQRRTLIKTKRASPCLTQFWDSQPWKPVSLYRKAEGSTGAEVFLGEFEVVGVAAPPENANVSLLCIIADGKILLNARDNTAEQFLEVRRTR